MNCRNLCAHSGSFTRNKHASTWHPGKTDAYNDSDLACLLIGNRSEQTTRHNTKTLHMVHKCDENAYEHTRRLKLPLDDQTSHTHLNRLNRQTTNETFYPRHSTQGSTVVLHRKNILNVREILRTAATRNSIKKKLAVRSHPCTSLLLS